MYQKYTAAMVGVGVCALVVLAQATSLADETALGFVAPAFSNPDGTHGFAKNGEEIELSLIGGSDKNTSWVMVLGEPLLHSVASFARNETLKITLENISFEGHAVPRVLQSLHITLSPKPATMPYLTPKALSLELWADGQYNIGVRKNLGGWPARENARQLTSGKMKLQRTFPKLELIISPAKLRVQAFQTDGSLAFEYESGEIPELASWEEYGMNILLQKRQEGAQTQLIATIGRVSASKENMP